MCGSGPGVDLGTRRLVRKRLRGSRPAAL